MKKFIGILCMISIFSICTATEIRFFPDTGEIGKWCLVAVDIVIDAEDKKIAATDVVIESSLAFVDFVPSKLFPYFLPPKIKGNTVHLVGFNTDPKNRMTWTGSLGKIYLQQKNSTDVDGKVSLYFTNVWSTTDTNLSIAWGIDVLNTVGKAYYRFVDGWLCAHTSPDSIPWGIAKTKLKTLLAKIDRDQIFKKIFNQNMLLVYTGILLLLMILFFYYQISKPWKKS